MQKEAFPNARYFLAPDEIPNLFRSTRRGGLVNVVVLSLAVIADTEKKFRDFLDAAKDRGCRLRSIEESIIFEFGKSEKNNLGIVEEWRKARRAGSAMIGSQISAKNRKDRTAQAIAKIKDRWKLPSGAWPTKVLLEEAGLSLNTVKTHLGNRIWAQRNYESAQKRKDRKNEQR